MWCQYGAQPPYPSDPMYCADCGEPLAVNPMERVRCHSGDVWLAEPPHPRDTWYGTPSKVFAGVRYWLYMAPTERLT